MRPAAPKASDSRTTHRPSKLRVTLVACATALLCAHGALAQAATQPQPAAAFAADPACQSLVPASQGGPMPQGDTAVLRWLGTSNFELAFRDQVIIMDTFYDRPPRTASLGFSIDQVRRADAILIGHAHYDHISDVAPVAEQTGAPVVGSALSTETAQKLGVPARQVVTVAGGETLHYGDVLVKPVHIVHSTIQKGLIPALKKLYEVDAPPLSAEDQAHAAAVAERGTFDPRVVTEGTMGFLFEFPGGYKVLWFDSVGDPNDNEKQLAKDLGPGVDVAIFPWTPHPISETQLAYTFQHLALFQPKLYVPDHHDGIFGVWLDNGLAPLFMKIRDELPDTSFVDPLYRSAICLDTRGDARTDYFVGR